MNTQRIAFIFCVFLFSLPFSGCNSGQIFSPTVTTTEVVPISTPTKTETPTQIPTPTQTATPENTAIPEFKQFKICAPEKYYECPIDVEDLFNGNYFNWLNSLSKPFDPAKVKEVPLELYGARPPKLQYNHETVPNFPVKGTEPFRRDVTAGYTSFIGKDGKTIYYIVMPIEYFDKKEPTKNKWVITVQSLYYAKLLENGSRIINTWRNKMATTIILTNNQVPPGGVVDELVDRTFRQFPDMKERFQGFVDGDFSTLSQTGIVVGNDIGWSPENPNWGK